MRSGAKKRKARLSIFAAAVLAVFFPLFAFFVRTPMLGALYTRENALVTFYYGKGDFALTEPDGAADLYRKRGVPVGESCSFSGKEEDLFAILQALHASVLYEERTENTTVWHCAARGKSVAVALSDDLFTVGTPEIYGDF